MVDTSRSPVEGELQRVRGMGVADIMRAWGCSEPGARAARCVVGDSEPGACSSAMARARLGSSTPSWIRAWVPVKQVQVRPRTPGDRTSRRGAARVLPGEQADGERDGAVLGRYAENTLGCCSGCSKGGTADGPTVAKCCSDEHLGRRHQGRLPLV